MNNYDYRKGCIRHVEESHMVGRNLIEKALHMRSLSYLSDVKAKLLTETIYEVDYSRKQILVAKREIERQFRQSQKMELLGILVGGIAHDFNNMLAGITGNIHLARRNVNDPAKLHIRLDTIEKISIRAGEMIQQLLAFARKGKVTMRPLELVGFLRDAARLIKSAIPEDIALQLQIPTTELFVLGDPIQLQQVVMNLLINARDAVRGREFPAITLSLEALEADDALLRRFQALDCSKFARIRVSDNGSGIPEDLLGKIFEPFFTTKEVGQGSGLGLSMVYGAVRNHGGLIDVSSELRKGTAFSIYFPIVPSQKQENEGRRSIREGEGETILLADDEEMVLNLLGELMQMLNYKVLSAGNGRDALELYLNDPSAIKAVIADVVMPGMGGIDMALAIRNAGYETPIILCTGYDRDERANNYESIGNCQLLSKPFELEMLSETLQRLCRDGK